MKGSISVYRPGSLLRCWLIVSAHACCMLYMNPLRPPPGFPRFNRPNDIRYRLYITQHFIIRFLYLIVICTSLYLLLATDEKSFDLDSVSSVACLGDSLVDKTYSSCENISLCHFISSCPLFAILVLFGL
jgi:hypothetical protein